MFSGETRMWIGDRGRDYGRDASERVSLTSDLDKLHYFGLGPRIVVEHNDFNSLLSEGLSVVGQVVRISIPLVLVLTEVGPSRVWAGV